MHKTMRLPEIAGDVLAMFTVLEFNITKEKVVDLLALTIEDGEVRDMNFSYHGKYQCPELYVNIGCLKNQYTIVNDKPAP